MKKKIKKIVICGVAFSIGLLTANVWNMCATPVEKIERLELPSPPTVYTSKNEIINLMKSAYPQLIEKDEVVETKHSISGKEIEQKLILIAERSSQARLQVITTLADLLRQLDDDPNAIFACSNVYWCCAKVFGKLKAIEEIDCLIKHVAYNRGFGTMSLSFTFPFAQAIVDIGEPALPKLLLALEKNNFTTPYQQMEKENIMSVVSIINSEKIKD
ncbi:MAG: hypothetical protein HY819_14315 [Acidobacteria bacterium]|nr:hypothetical protein [Acidobacteriota bacterium]